MFCLYVNACKKVYAFCVKKAQNENQATNSNLPLPTYHAAHSHNGNIYK